MSSKASICCCIFVLLAVCSSEILKADEHETVQIVPYGKAAVLKCKSNDKDHNFLFWQADNNMIGPYNNFDQRKYDYEVLSGNLTIKVLFGFVENFWFAADRLKCWCYWLGYVERVVRLPKTINSEGGMLCGVASFNCFFRYKFILFCNFVLYFC